METALAWLSGLSGELQPNLGLKLLHFLGEIETRAVYRSAEALHPLKEPAESWTAELVTARYPAFAQALSERGDTLRRAALHLRQAEPLYQAFATPSLLAHRTWLLGRTVLPSTPELAVLYLQDAARAFEARHDTRRAALCRRDLAVCHAARGRLEDCQELLVTSAVQAPEPLTVLDDLALWSQDMLPTRGGRHDADEILSQVLDLDNVVPFDRGQP